MIKGIEVILYAEIVIGYDEFGTEITEKTPQKVQDVLVSPASAQEILDNNELYGRKAVYTLAIPKDDIHDWENKEVEFFGHRWRTFGIPAEGIASLIPLRWNKKVTVERVEG